MPSAPSLDITKEIVSATKVLAPAAKRIEKALKTLDVTKIPQGALVDFLYELRQLQKQLKVLITPFDDAIPVTMKLVEDHFVNTLRVGESSGTQGQRARVQITENVIPVPEDWPKFYAHLKKTGSFELLNKALNREAIKERWDNKKQVPGVKKFVAKKVSCTKLSGK